MFPTEKDIEINLQCIVQFSNQYIFTSFCVFEEYSVMHSVEYNVQYKVQCSVQDSVQYIAKYSVEYSVSYNSKEAVKGSFFRE